MKNSNKLLILLIVLVFSIPLIMVMGFKTAIKENRYVVKNRFGVEDIAFKSLKPFKVVKLYGGPVINQLRCNIKNGKEYAYKFVNYNSNQYEDGRSDSCSIHFIKDTLVIMYKVKTDEAYKAENYYNGVELDLIIPEGVPVIAEGAKVVINTIKDDSPKNIMIDMSKKAELEIMSSLDRRPELSDSLSEQNRVLLSNYNIKSTESKVMITAHARITNLKIDASNNSQVTINQNVIIDSLFGSLSPETIINAPYKFVKNLQ
ncbi:hypothetical protein [Niabella ginsengisoli]|uniref:Auto-transporter adhesin head GIN domain-containing protein n=1 Tax=Niabella ginsengisoli TaxID=522298 RepID=A0ABS9SPM3_9BACT|nr:hypothetical protein [Niabella ginsengisoli]MCH5600359.1 hypothetical protein [Niabella ginsengisoli]